MSDTAVDSLDTLADTSNASGTAPLLAPEANHTLQDTLSDPLADGADGDSVQMFAARPDDSVPSLRSLKHDINYLSQEDGDSCLDAVLSVQLARFRYNSADPATPERLGFMIDDLPADSPAVAPDGRHVDVYGFTSMAVAALQSQQREISALRAQLVALSARLEKIEG